MQYRHWLFWALALTLAFTVGCGGDGAGGDNEDDTSSSASDTGGDADTDTEAFGCLAVEPDAISILADGEMRIIGTGLPAQIEITLIETGGAEVSLGTVSTITNHSTLIPVALGDVAEGSYTVHIANPGNSDESSVCPDTIDWLNQQPPTVTAVGPHSAWTGLPDDNTVSDQPTVVLGTLFEATPVVSWIPVDHPDERIAASIVTFTSDQQLGTVCPSESEAMALGMYYLEVSNPNGLSAYWMDGAERGQFEITGTAPPSISNVDPFRGPSSAEAVLTFNGNFFMDGATAQAIENTDNGPVVHDLAVTFVDDQTLTVTIAGSTLSQGIYPLRIVNPDGQYALYYSYSVTSGAAAHLSAPEDAGQSLQTPRWRHASAPGFDHFGGSFIYTTGGIHSDGTILDDVEVLPISVYGELDAPFFAEQWQNAANPRVPNNLNTRRSGHALVRVDKWIYAIGGNETNTTTTIDATNSSLATIERARILGMETRPVIASVTTDTEAGSLAAGTWYYQVSSIDSKGESIASSKKLVPGGAGTVTLSWSAVDGASGYNIYRNADSSGNGGATTLLATLSNVTSFDDDGSNTPNSITPLPFGSLSKWTELTTKLMNEVGDAEQGREGLGSIAVTIPSGSDNVDDKTFIYVVGGRTNAGAGSSAYLATGARAEVLDNGDLGDFVYLTKPMNVPRAFFTLITNQGQKDSGFNPDPGDGGDGGGGGPIAPILFAPTSIAIEPTLLIAVQGDDGYDTSDTGGGNYGTNTIEITEILTADGDNAPPMSTGNWALQSSTTVSRAHGNGAVLYFDYLFPFGGVKTENLVLDSLDTQPSSSPRYEYDENVTVAEDIIGGQQSTSASVTDRAYYQMMRINGFIWAIGGHDGSSPLSSIEKLQQ